MMSCEVGLCNDGLAACSSSAVGSLAPGVSRAWLLAQMPPHDPGRICTKKKVLSLLCPIEFTYHKTTPIPQRRHSPSDRRDIIDFIEGGGQISSSLFCTIQQQSDSGSQLKPLAVRSTRGFSCDMPHFS